MTTRRDLIKWVLYLGATAALPKFATHEELPHDVLEGISMVPKRLAYLSGDPARYRAAEDDAFERCMQDMWRQQNGSARYVRVFQDMALLPARVERNEETGEEWERPESYASFFQYRRA